MLHCWVRNNDTGEIEAVSFPGFVFLTGNNEFVSESEYIAYCQQQEALAVQE